jgi:hypothetical protein
MHQAAEEASSRRQLHRCCEAAGAIELGAKGVGSSTAPTTWVNKEVLRVPIGAQRSGSRTG